MSVDGTPIQGLKSERLRALVAFLLLHRHAPQTRAHIAVTLWPESTDAVAKANLRRRLHDLKQQLPEGDWLQVSKSTIQWNGQSWFECDVADFENALAQALPSATKSKSQDMIALLEKAVMFYQGDLFPSCYDDWIVPHREQFQQRMMTALDALITGLAEQNQVRSALEYAQQLRQMDPLQESAYCHLMRLYAQEGDRASALRAYHQCMTILQEELGVSPSPNTYKIYETLLLAEPEPTPACNLTSSPAVNQATSAKSASPGAAQKVTQKIPVLTQPALPLVGRQPEWESLSRWQTEALSQTGANFLMLKGELGIGKTRLLEELAWKIQSNGGDILWAKGYEAEMLRPYGAWVDAFDGAGATDFFQEFKGLLQAGGATAAQNRERLFEMAIQFLRELSTKATVLVVLDDLQWFDETSIAFCHYAARLLHQQASVLFACSARRRELEDNLPAHRLVQALQREHRIRVTELTPLDNEPTLALAEAVGYVPTGENMLFTQSGGNPLFVLEIARADSQAPTQSTDTLDTIIQRRLEQLADDTKTIIPWAAALGHHFDPHVLAKVADYPILKLLTAIEQLEHHGIIRSANTGSGDMVYNFAHDIVRQVAYNQFSPLRRQLMHTHIAQVLDGLASENSPLIDEVAHHADLGRDRTLAARSCLAAAQRCIRVFAFSEATALIQRGMMHAQSLEPSERVHFQLKLTRAWIDVGVHRSQADTFKKDLTALIQEAATLGLKDDEAIGLTCLIMFNYEHGHFQEIQQQSLQTTQRSVTASQSQIVLSMLARTASCLAAIEQEMSRVEALLTEIEEIGDRLGLPPEKLQENIDIPMALGFLHRFKGNFDEAIKYLGQGWQLAKNKQDHWSECKFLLRWIMAMLEVGQPESALDACHEFIQVSEKMGDEGEIAHAAALSALTQYYLNGESMTEQLSQSCQVLEELDSPRILAYVETMAAQADLSRDQTAQALTRGKHALALAKRAYNLDDIVLAVAILVNVYQTMQNRKKVRELIAEVQTQLSQFPPSQRSLSHRANASLMSMGLEPFS